ncbi:MAG: methyltransferase domain-containing protein [Patescibacteria group bacterium]
MKLNLGCGRKKLDGFTGVDRIKTPAVDVIHDLNVFPYPFPDNSAEEIVMDNVLEHLDDVVKVMTEIYRLAAPDALVRIYVPYFKSNSAFTDPTHRHFFSETSFKYFSPDNPLNFYSPARFAVIKTELIVHTEYRDLKHFCRNLLPFKKLLNYFLFNIYDEIYFELRVLK